jgi:hypothetical protein
MWTYNCTERGPLEDQSVDWRIILKCAFKYMMGRGLIHVGQDNHKQWVLRNCRVP